MSQKTAKEFLVNNDPARFYAFFLKATQIDKLIEAVRQAEDLKDQVLTTLEDYEFGFQQLKATGQLTSPADAAKRIIDYLARPDFGSNPVSDVRDA
jgi:hypothetical protein